MPTTTLLEFVRPILKGSRRDLCLAAMYYLRDYRAIKQCTAAELKSALTDARVPKARVFNVADILGKAGHLATVLDKNTSNVNMWRLTESGDRKVREALNIAADTIEIEMKNDISVLNALVGRIADDVVRGYIEESVLAYRVGALRASVVFLWSGAIRHLQDKALVLGVSAFNACLLKHDPKARHVGKIEDLSSVKDVIQLLAFREVGLVDKGEWATLQDGLDLRNRCGHPTKYKPGIKKVSAFIEDVVGIVF